MTKELVLGIDLGTSGVKVGVLDVDSFALLSVSMRDYDNEPLQDTEVLFEATLEALKEAVSVVGKGVQISAIGLSGQMHGAALYNQAGEIIHPLINWQDREYSSDRVVEKVRSIIGPAGADDSGIEMASGLTGTVLFGIKENYPDLFAKIDKFVLPTDFIRGKLLGRLDHSTDPTNAFGTGLFNTRESRWHQGLIRELGLQSGIFPDVCDTTEIAGRLHYDILHLLNLDKPVQIIIGGGDNQMSMLGSGLISQSSPILINVGTAAQISMVTSEYIRRPGVDTRSFFDGLYAFVGTCLAGGSSYQWLRDHIRQEDGVELSYAEMDDLAAQIPAGSEGLVFCPGPSRSNPERVSGFYGNRAYQSSAGHRARAVMEGVILDLYEPYLGIQSINTGEFMVGAGKGLQRSSVWSQIAADIFGKPILISNFENALFGAALMAAAGIGAVEDLDQALDAIQYDQQMDPDLENTAHYQNEAVKNWKSVIGMN